MVSEEKELNFDELESVVVNEENINGNISTEKTYIEFQCKNEITKIYERKWVFGIDGRKNLYDFIREYYVSNLEKDFPSLTKEEFEKNTSSLFEYVEPKKIKQPLTPEQDINDSLEKILGKKKELINLFILLEKNLTKKFRFSVIQIPLDEIEFNEQEKEWFKDQNIKTRKELYQHYATRNGDISFFILYQRQEEAVGDKEGKKIEKEDVKEKLTPMPFMIHYEDCCYGFNSTKNQGINFLSNIFTYEVHWQHKIFEGNSNTVFDKAIFLEKPHFSHATFNNKVDFLATRFKKGVSFYNTKFEQKADFRFSNFEYTANFKLANFKNTFFLKHINPVINKNENKNNKNEITYSPIQLDLKSAIIEEMDWEDTKLEVKEVANRETFLVLKQFAIKKGDDIRALDFQMKEMNKYYEQVKKIANRKIFLILKQSAIKQNDNISALDFHTKEMNKYYEELKFKEKLNLKDKINKYILGFEKCISYYGTEPVRGLSFFAIINILFLITNTLLFLSNEPKCQISSFNCEIFLKILIETLLPFKVAAKDFNLVHLAAFIINPILLYEIIKSFRKYSRKL